MGGVGDGDGEHDDAGRDFGGVDGIVVVIAAARGDDDGDAGKFLVAYCI